ncbi:hypothetical protein FOZ61_010713 [Perkinsus olseni]|uniref:Uncharacterized protein n=1 Tax=Perkinsus olseni TaxID=32597 RepID=A0A7J6MFW3_PEROL|nr:hypothetical protein FOZ61_010713 [Perkinsus olseni]
MALLVRRQLRRLPRKLATASYCTSAFSYPLGTKVLPDYQRLGEAAVPRHAGIIVADATYDLSVEDILVLDDIPPDFAFCRMLSENSGDLRTREGSLTLLNSLGLGRYSAATITRLEAQFGVGTVQCDGPEKMSETLRKRKFDKIVINFPHALLPKKIAKFKITADPEQVTSHGRKSSKVRDTSEQSITVETGLVRDVESPSLNRYLTAIFATAKGALRHPHGELHLRLLRQKTFNRPGRALERAVYHSGLALIRTIDLGADEGSALSRLGYRPRDPTGRKINLNECLTLVFGARVDGVSPDSYDDFLGKSLIL